VSLDDRKWKWFNLIEFFKMYAGKYYPKDSYNKGNTPLISSSDTYNGVMNFTDLEPKFDNCLTIGKIGMSTYYQPKSFIASPDVTILEPLFLMNSYNALFLVSLLNMDKYKWSYGRQIRLNDSKKLRIQMPANKDNKPDFEFMEYYIKTLPYSKFL